MPIIKKKKLAFKLIWSVFTWGFHAKSISNIYTNQSVFQEGESQASGGMVSERIMGEPSCNSCCSDSRSAGVMRWTSLQSDNREAERGAES